MNRLKIKWSRKFVNKKKHGDKGRFGNRDPLTILNT